jgi:hypothetical protein
MLVTFFQQFVALFVGCSHSRIDGLYVQHGKGEHIQSYFADSCHFLAPDFPKRTDDHGRESFGGISQKLIVPSVINFSMQRSNGQH